VLKRGRPLLTVDEATAARRTRSDERLPLVAVALVAVTAAVSYLLISVGGHFLDPRVYPVIRADGAGYYSYLPAYLIQHDPTFTQFVAHDLHGFDLPSIGLSLQPNTGNYLEKYPIGEALMLLPFFLVGHLLAMVAGQPADGYSRIEEVAAGFGGLVYMVLGLLVLSQSLRRYFSPLVTAATMVSIVFGSNLFHYGTFDSMFSHTFSFFLVALLIVLVHRFYERDGPAGTAVLIGLVMGMNVLVRPANVIFGFLIILFGITSWRQVADRVRFFLRRSGRLLIILGGMLLLFVPQMIVWHIATGHWLVYSYGSERFNFATPRITDVLFRLYYHGFLPWAPIMILALLGIPLMWRHARPMLVATVVIFVIHLYIVASWSTWFFGGGFGHRAFIDEFPLLAFGLASLYASATTIPRRLVVAVPAALACVVTMVMMLHYWEFVLSPGGASREEYIHILFHRL
jgi:hypothetical protein